MNFFSASILFATSFLLVSASNAQTLDYSTELVIEAKQKDLARTKQWHKLLHYRKRLFGGFKSEADGLAFFFSKDGKTNPESELEATIRAFFISDAEIVADAKSFPKGTVPQTPQHPQCRFPARYRWLKRELGFDSKKLVEKKCDRFERFEKNINAKSATVVFSSYYLNNPASAFGHTLLRLNQAESSYTGKRFELLDYGVSYAASVTISNPLLYGIYGVFGLFPGTFTSIPYYYKVREYNDFESRDLWEYDLNLTAEQTAMMVAHIWELGSTYFDYFYLSENCSYHVLSILEAGNPDLELLNLLPRVVIPSDSVRALMKVPGLVRNIHFRPSARLQFLERESKLNSAQKEKLKKILQTKSTDGDADVDTLDAAIDFTDYRFNKDLLSPDSQASHFKQTLLMARAKQPMASKELVVAYDKNDMPHLGHNSARLSLEHGYSWPLKHHTRITYRTALHDLVDSPIGYPEYAQIEFMSSKLRYNYDEKTFWLEDFSLLRVVSVTPYSSYYPQISWRLNVGATTVRDKSCENCMSGTTSVGGGLTVGPLIALLDSELSIAPKYKPFFAKVGVGPYFGLRLPITKKFSSLIYASYKISIPSNSPTAYEWGAEGRLSFFTDFAINAKYSRYQTASEASAGLMYYF